MTAACWWRCPGRWIRSRAASPSCARRRAMDGRSCRTRNRWPRWSSGNSRRRSSDRSSRSPSRCSAVAGRMRLRCSLPRNQLGNLRLGPNPLHELCGLVEGIHSGHPWPSPFGQLRCAHWQSCRCVEPGAFVHLRLSARYAKAARKGAFAYLVERGGRGMGQQTVAEALSKRLNHCRE